MKSVSWYSFLWQALDWVFPPICAGCGKPGTRWCDECDRKLVKITGPVCPVCGYPSRSGNLCGRCKQDDHAPYVLRSVYTYQDSLREGLHQLKYRNNLGFGDFLAGRMADYLGGQDWHLDYIVPVPLGKLRARERGYNQAAAIAYPLSLLTGVRYSGRILSRTRETGTQVSKQMSVRKMNVSGAFSAQSRLTQGKAFLIVDDIITTGSTIKECARTLLAAGAHTVYGISPARAMLKDGNLIL